MTIEEQIELNLYRAQAVLRDMKTLSTYVVTEQQKENQKLVVEFLETLHQGKHISCGLTDDTCPYP